MATHDNFGINIAETGLQSAQQSLDIWANNLANQSTPGFDAAIPTAISGQTQSVPVGLWLGQGAVSLKNLTAPSGQTLMPSNVTLHPGSLRPTGQPTDLALTVEGYFPVRGTNGILLTRNGTFSRNSLGQLATPTGQILLGLNLQPVTVPPGAFTIHNGVVSGPTGQVLAQLAIALVPNPEGLKSVGASLYQAQPASGAVQYVPALGTDVVPGMLESSNVSMPTALVSLVNLEGQFSMAADAIKVATQMQSLTNNMAILP